MEDVWNIVKETRKSFLSKNDEPECQHPDTLVSDKNIRDNLKHLTSELKLKTSLKPNVSYQNKLKTAAEMFTYLNFCPPLSLSLLRSILKYQTPRDVILGLTSIMKTSKNAEKQTSLNIFMKVMEIMKLDHHKQIQFITTKKCFVEDKFGNCTTKKHRTRTEESTILG